MWWMALCLGSAWAADPESPWALSVGTGPQPLNTLTLGLTGAGARLLLPGQRVSPYFGAGVTSASVGSWSEGDYGARYVTRGTTANLTVGLRVDARQPEDDLVPYGAFAVLGNWTSAKSGTARALDGENGFGGGGYAALGLDGFLTPHFSIGAELGAMGVYWAGANEYDGNVDTHTGVLVLTSAATLQATVWR